MGTFYKRKPRLELITFFHRHITLYNLSNKSSISFSYLKHTSINSSVIYIDFIGHF